MKVKAILRKFQCSPKKVRLVIDKIRGLKVDDASTKLLFINKKSSQPILKLLKSAVSNAENNFKLSKESLILEEVKVDSDGMYKRITPRARGTAAPILKRLSRVEIVLSGDANEVTKIEKVKSKKETKDSKKTLNVEETNKITDNK